MARSSSSRGRGVTSVGAPPAAETRFNTFNEGLVTSAYRMTSSAPHVPKMNLLPDATVRSAAPIEPLHAVAVKNAMDRLSGDQNGSSAPSAPASGRAGVGEDRSQRRSIPPLEVTKASWRPSGESAKVPVPGAAMSVRISGGVEGGASPRCRSAGIASAAATRTAAAATIHGRCAPGRFRRDGRRRLSGDIECAVERQTHVMDVADALLGPCGGIVADTGRAWATCRAGRDPLRLGTNDSGQRVGDVLAGKRTRPRQHLEQHCAECPDVRAAIDRLPARLLRRHVGGGAEDHPGLRRARSALESSWRRRSTRPLGPSLWPNRSRGPSPAIGPDLCWPV